MEETLIACQTFSLKQTGDFTTDESATVRSRESFVCTISLSFVKMVEHELLQQGNPKRSTSRSAAA